MRHEIKPRIDEHGVGWCDEGCPQCKQTNRYLLAHHTEVISHDCALWDFWLSSFDICPVHARRVAEELKKLKELLQVIRAVNDATGSKTFECALEFNGLLADVRRAASAAAREEE